MSIRGHKAPSWVKRHMEMPIARTCCSMAWQKKAGKIEPVLDLRKPRRHGAQTEPNILINGSAGILEQPGSRETLLPICVTYDDVMLISLSAALVRTPSHRARPRNPSSALKRD